MGNNKNFTHRYAKDITQQVVHSDMRNVAHQNRLTVKIVDSMVREVGKLMINIELNNLKNWEQMRLI